MIAVHRDDWHTVAERLNAEVIEPITVGDQSGVAQIADGFIEPIEQSAMQIIDKQTHVASPRIRLPKVVRGEQRNGFQRDIVSQQAFSRRVDPSGTEGLGGSIFLLQPGAPRRGEALINASIEVQVLFVEVEHNRHHGIIHKTGLCIRIDVMKQIAHARLPVIAHRVVEENPALEARCICLRRPSRIIEPIECLWIELEVGLACSG